MGAARTIVDAKILAAPSPTKNDMGTRDPKDLMSHHCVRIMCGACSTTSKEPESLLEPHSIVAALPYVSSSARRDSVRNTARAASRRPARGIARQPLGSARTLHEVRHPYVAAGLASRVLFLRHPPTDAQRLRHGRNKELRAGRAPLTHRPVPGSFAFCTQAR